MKRLHLVLILIYFILMFIGAFTRVKAEKVKAITEKNNPVVKN